MNAIYSTLAVKSVIAYLLLLWLFFLIIKPNKMKKQLTPETLVLNGFIRSEWFDRNDPKDTFDTMKFVEFTRAINTDFRIEVTFYYAAEIEGKFDTLKETTCELNAGGGNYFLKLEQNIEALENVYNLLTNKKSNEKSISIQ